MGVVRPAIVEHVSCASDDVLDVVHHHVAVGTDDTTSREWPEINDAPGDDSVRLRAIRMVGQSGTPVSAVKHSDPVGVQMVYDVLEEGHVLSPYFTVVTDVGVDLFSTADSDASVDEVPRKVGRYISTAWVPAGLLADGCHYVRVVMRSVRRKARPFAERDIISFTVVDDSGNTVGASWWEGRARGIISPQLKWTTEYVPEEMVIEG